MTDKKTPLIIIAGPTAAGKSAAAVELCRRIGGSVISGDSMQVYRFMDIGTAKITDREKQGIPHYLLDVIPPDAPWNAFLFQKKAKEAMAEILSGGRIPVVCGGTGFYIDALLSDTDFTLQEEDVMLRQRLLHTAQTEGEERLHRTLEDVDPASAAAIHPNNVKRVIRAIEFHSLTGEKISEHNERQRLKKPPYDYLYFAVTMDRASLYERIDRRVDAMERDGLVSEVKSLLDRGYGRGLVSMQGLGYKEVADYLDGRCTLKEALDRVRQGTRHYAKRQLTWLRRRDDVIWLRREDYGDAGALAEKMEEMIRVRGLLGENE